MTKMKIRVKISGDDSGTAYVALPGCPDEPKHGFVAKTICLDDVLNNFRGPRVNLDFDKEGMLIGIEILA